MLLAMPHLKSAALALFMVSIVLFSWQLLTPAPAVQVGGNDKLYHAMGFTWLAFSADMAWWTQGRYWLLKALPLAGYGLLTECIQYFVPGRSFSIYDWLADCSGVLLIYPLLAWFVLGIWRTAQS